MYAYIVMSVLLILVLLKLNHRAIERLKRHKHEMQNLKMLLLQKEELWDSSFEYKRLSKIQEFRIQELRNEVIRQQELNIELVTKYNSIRESVIDIPKKHGRFFAVNVTKDKLLLHFSEN